MSRKNSQTSQNPTTNPTNPTNMNMWEEARGGRGHSPSEAVLNARKTLIELWSKSKAETPKLTISDFLRNQGQEHKPAWFLKEVSNPRSVKIVANVSILETATVKALANCSESDLNELLARIEKAKQVQNILAECEKKKNELLAKIEGESEKTEAPVTPAVLA